MKEKEHVEEDASKGAPENVKEKVSKLQAAIHLQDPIKKESSSRIKKNHPFDLILGNLDEQIVTGKRYANMVRFTCFLSLTELKNVKEALVYEFWVKVMQVELEQFERNNVWQEDQIYFYSDL